MSNTDDDHGIIDYSTLIPKFIPNDNDIYFIHKKIPNEIIEKVLNIWKKYDLVRKNDKIIIVNVKIIDNLWKNTDLYIEPYSFTEKYINSKKDILQLNEKVKNPPEIHLDINNNIVFINGRHRFANLRDNNVINIPVIIFKKEIPKFKKLGLIKQNSKSKSNNTKLGGRKNKTKRNKKYHN